MSKQTLQELITEIEGEAMKVKSNYKVEIDKKCVLQRNVSVSSIDLNIVIGVGYYGAMSKEKNVKLATDMLDFIVDKLKNEAINEVTNEVV